MRKKSIAFTAKFLAIRGPHLVGKTTECRKLCLHQACELRWIGCQLSKGTDRTAKVPYTYIPAKGLILLADYRPGLLGSPSLDLIPSWYVASQVLKAIKHHKDYIRCVIVEGERWLKGVGRVDRILSKYNTTYIFYDVPIPKLADRSKSYTYTELRKSYLDVEVDKAHKPIHNRSIITSNLERTLKEIINE